MRTVLFCCVGLSLAAFSSPVGAESPPLLGVAHVGRGASFLVELPQDVSGLDPPGGSVSQVLSFGRQGFKLHSVHFFEPFPVPKERKPEWAKSRPAMGVAFEVGSWTVAVEYLRRDRSPIIDRGRFGGSDKFFVGAQYRWNEDVSAYLGISREVSAGFRWRLGDDGEVALTYVSRPNREIRTLFDPLRDEHNITTLTYGWKF